LLFGMIKIFGMIKKGSKLGKHALVYACFLVLLALAQQLASEKQILVTLLTYIPQWPFLVPVGIYLLIALVQRRRKVIFLSLGMLIFWMLVFSDIPLGLRAAPSGKHARVLTWNIQHNKNNIDGYASVIKAEKPDILCLQEANNVVDSPQMWQLLQKKIPEYEFIAAGDLAIGVRQTPKHSAHSVKLASWKYRPLRIWGWRNHILEAVVEIEGKPLTVFTAHFDRYARPDSLAVLKRRDGSFLEAENASRKQQATDTLRWIAGRTTPDFIFTGDLNTPPRGNLYRSFTAISQDVVAHTHAPIPAYTFPATFPQIRIDHVFCGGSLRPLTAHIPASTASDHRPVVADIGL
jgi:vancomycin resistance protein VanJ